MKLKFNADLDYQRRAIESVVHIFKGQELNQSNFTVSYGPEAGMLQTDLGVGNRLDLTPEEILKNVQDIQVRNGLPRSERLDGMHFTIEMETGTGKTYVYLRTIYELHKHYGFTKFVIVVPSVAIREGVYKSLQITRDHFDELYDRTPAEYFIYDSQKLDQVRNFATATTIQIMIINIDAFRKSFEDPEKEDKANVIHRPNDRLNGYRPIEFIQQTNPIVIIDEPQSVDTTPKSKEAIASLNPLCTLRYSATHVDKYHMVYRLDAVDAYNQKLVKKIEVMSVRSEPSFNVPYIKLIEVKERKAKIELDVESRGKIKRMTKTVKYGDDLYDISGERELYRGYIVEQIDWTEGNEAVEINGYRLGVGDAIGDVDDDAIKRYQIRKTIEEHLNKELWLRPRGIKVLSLFFIDKVAHYRDYDQEGQPVKGKYAIMFEEEYRNLMQKPKYRPLWDDPGIDQDIEKVHNGYFAQDKKGRLKDTKGNTEADTDVYNLIMRDKERLLSLDEPLRFIFSHSALREGWDNPNVFQICTLKDSSGTYVSRRQEIGRGLRLAVNQNGERVHDDHINILTVMANESYEEFVATLQREIEEDTGIQFGKIEKHVFAKLVYVDEATEEPVQMGYDLSLKLYEELKQNGYIDKQSKATEKLKRAIENYDLHLSDEFQPWLLSIVKEIKRHLQALPIKDGTKKKKVHVNMAVLNQEEFTRLWDKIKYKTVYSVDFDSEQLIDLCIAAIQEMRPIEKIRIVSRKGRVEIDHVTGVQAQTISEKVEDYVSLHHTLPDLITELQNRTNLTRKTIVRILTGCKRLDDFKNNPQKFIEEVANIIQRQMRLLLKDGVKYYKIGDDAYYAVELFQNEELLAYLNDNAIPSEKSPFDHILYDSEVEERFAKRFEHDENVKVYVKLPSWFKIDTPIGSYNPDWALVIEKDGEEKLYFVLETKGQEWEGELRPGEAAKIAFARKHFQAIGTDVEFIGPENDVERFMLQVLSR
ncbi:type III restriction endonuclease subunit R [Geobacillus thermoleovorans]|uniref:Type III restriction endonuclease subunit R n=1 Tax=Geobacillus thermopakistaniensis (strain MAS1) TaxID=1408282 RepID=A0A7U9P5Q6_GEOTM|nr:DEAD/DEAH box helicase family protein [Geobacillus sp. MAS1]AMV10622.1 type III restriction endonuclease subunit R [Geobacillus thermoleovorans]ESU71817.1 type III restriction endonuclease subunit R [Geobacillus sp. MAS1]